MSSEFYTKTLNSLECYNVTNNVSVEKGDNAVVSNDLTSILFHSMPKGENVTEVTISKK